MAQRIYAEKNKKPPQLRIKGWMTYEEAGLVLGLSENTVREYVARGLLERGTFYTFPLISQSSVQWYQENRTEPGKRDKDREERSLAEQLAMKRKKSSRRY